MGGAHADNGGSKARAALLRYIVRDVNSGFPADIVLLQVAEHGSDARVLTVNGEVDALTAPQLGAVLTAQLEAAQVVVVDLDGVRLLSSRGLRVLFEANEFAIQQDRELRLVCNSSNAHRVLATSGLLEHFTFAASVSDALQDVR